MIVECLIDTNILVYAATGRGPDTPKRLKALDLIENVNFATSGQILEEFYVTATKKARHPLSVEDALFWVDRLSERPVVAIDEGIVKRAIVISQRFQTSYWDGAIIAASERLNAEILYTEDLNHGQFYGSIQVINPYFPQPQ